MKTHVHSGDQERKVVDENMLKYNEDDVNYANSKQDVFEVGIMK